MNRVSLPPMPPSNSRFWGDNEINKFDEPEYEKHEHEFKRTPEGAECVKCHFGLIGPIEVRDGKLFHNNEPLGL